MEIGKFKQAKSHMVRPSSEKTIPKQKPFTRDMFREKADLYIKGLIGGFPQDEMLLKLQAVLDRAVDQGTIKAEEGIDFLRNRKQELLDFAKENQGETLPGLDRSKFSDGTNPNSLKALEEINKAGALRLNEKIDLFKQLVKEGRTPNEAKKSVMEQFNIERNPKAGTPKWMTLGKQQLIDEGFKFTESKRGPKSTGGKERASKKRDLVTKETQASEKRFSTTKKKLGLGKTFENAHTANIFQAKALGAEYPVDALAPQTVKQNQVYAEELNDELKPLYKEQLKLKRAYDEAPTKQIAKLIDKNNTAIQNLVASGGKQGEKAANLLRGWNLDVVTGEPYLPEGGFNTLKAVDRGMTDMTLQQLKKKTPEDVVARKNYEELLKEMKGKKISIPEKTKTRDMFKDFNIRTSPKLKGVLIPGLEEIKEGLKTIPSDLAKKKYFAAGLKTLGIVATPLIAAGMYNDLSSGKSVVETLERNLIGTDIVGSTKDVLALSPEEREARSIVKQNELDKQIAQDFSDLDSDFQTPRIESKMSLGEAEQEYEKGMSRVKAEREQQEADIARARSINVQALKDLITGERFQPQPIPQQFMANGGRIGFVSGGLASLFKTAAKVSEKLRSLKNSAFENWNNVRMFGEQEGIAKNLQSYTNIPNKNRKISTLEDIENLKLELPEKYHKELDVLKNATEQNNFETAWKQYQQFEKNLDPTLKFENIPEEYFPMVDPTNEAFVITGPRESFKAPRYSFRTSMEIDPKTQKPTGKYQTEKLEVFDPETGTFREEGKVVGVTTEKGKEGLN